MEPHPPVRYRAATEWFWALSAEHRAVLHAAPGQLLGDELRGVLIRHGAYLTPERPLAEADMYWIAEHGEPIVP